MNNKLKSLLKVAISLSLGVFFIWIVWRTLTPEDIESIVKSFSTANYWWIALSVTFGVLSHLSRAYRWKYTLEPLGYQPRFLNSFFAVMIGYLLNLAFPRLGEVTRCGVMSQYEKIPVNKLFGTVIGERVADLLIMLIITGSVILIEFDKLSGMVYDLLGGASSKFSVSGILVLLLVAGALGGVGFLLLLKYSKNPFILKLKSFIIGILDGVKSILQMRQKWGFLFHTFFIWVMYVMMFYVSMLSLPETSNVPIMGIVAAFVMGGLSIVFVQGGLGAYPLAIMGVLLLYDVERVNGLALGWIMWTGQTILLIILGFLSMALIPVYNKNVTPQQNS